MAGTRPLRDYKTIYFFWRWLPFSLTDADRHVVDDGGGEVHGHFPPEAVDGFPCRPPRREKFAPPGVKKTAAEFAFSLSSHFR